MLAKADEAQRTIDEAKEAKKVIDEAAQAKQELARIKAEVKTVELKNSATRLQPQHSTDSILFLVIIC